MKQLVKNLVESGYLKTPRIIDAFNKIDRADFVLHEHRDEAYIDAPLSIGYGQTISQPLTVAFMLELLEPEPGNKILDIGAGSGWQTALLCSIVGEKGKVFAVEIISELEVFGRKNVSKYNFIKSGTASFHSFNAINGMPGEAPFDRIISAASSKEVPLAWKEQLKEGGRIIAPVGDSLVLLIKKPGGGFNKQVYPGFVFVPFVDK